ncbi:WD40 repeat-like protein [Metschnikowia bicuspidata var. bicuspidata NRRL YB-4993]|uniref:Pre-mRNA-splicing factor PRP46 n=1 Tax=Metschnikowia bicuspidata var. bicuspidata NRRL YB-4993 TaxID=869754 RepID=A0A1A0HA43_9ASCO|nr:WD40 repeat-like protein [Metschnikowia bicuspidata var. bicuspidata NRRL YB-4993]OBA20743.1 WD40 repeat-like protein [Metschnikowia bicuspidata var. bicuspidata NRRL YB-4993]
MPAQNDLLPRDDLSEAMYAGVKLDALVRAAAPRKTADTSESADPRQHTDPRQIADAIETTGTRQIADASQSADPRQTTQHSRPSRPWTLRRVLAGAHQGWVRSLAVDPVSNAWFVSGLADAQIKVWDLASGAVRAALPGHVLGVRALAVSRRHPYLFSGSEDKTLRCWDLERSHAPAGCQVRDYHGHVGCVYAVALHPELDLVFSAGRDLAVRVWDMRSRAPAMVLAGHRGDVTSLAVQTGDPQVCSAAMDSTVRLWDLRQQRALVTLTHHAKGVRLLHMHPHERTMVSADAAGCVRQWLLPGGRLLHQFGHVDAHSRDAGGIVNTLAVNPATDELFAGYHDGRMQFFDYASGRVLQDGRTTPSPGTASPVIYTSAFDMLGSRLITGENDKSIKIWGCDQ